MGVDIATQSALILSFVAFSSGMSLVLKNKRDFLYWVFFALCTCISLWALFFFLYKTTYATETFFYYHLFFNIWIAPLGLFFIQYLVNKKNRLNQILFTVSILVSVFLFFQITFNYENSKFIKSIVFLSPAFLLVQVFYLFLIDLGFLDSKNKAIEKSHLRWTSAKRKTIYGGAVFVFLLPTMDHLKSYGVGLPTIGNSFLALYIFFLGRALSSVRFTTLSGIFAKLILLVILALGLSIFYAVAFYIEITQIPVLIFYSFLISFLMINVLEPLHIFILNSLEKVTLIGFEDYSDLLKKLEKKIPTLLTLQELKEFIDESVEKIFFSKKCYFYCLDSQELKYEHFEDHLEKVKMASIHITHPLILQFEKLRSLGEIPIIHKYFLQNEVARVMHQTQKQELGIILDLFHELNCHLAVPIFYSKKLMGLILIDLGNDFKWDWGLLRFIYPFFEKVSFTLLYHEAYIKNTEKERLAELGELSAGLAHEIRNPLGSIKGAAQLISKSNSKESSQLYFNIILEEVERLNFVMSQFLDYAKLNKTDFTKIDLIAMIEKTLLIFQQSFQREIKIIFNAHQMQSLIIECNPVQLQQVLINVLKNTLVALEGKEQPRIEVDVSYSLNNEVLISVFDNGKGIKKEVLSKIFNPFFTTSIHGSGLGLSLSKKIVHNHHGTIEVNSIENQFTRFTIKLPLKEAGVH